MNKVLLSSLAIIAVTLIIASQSVYFVDQRVQAIVLQLGQPVGDVKNPESFIKQPGLHFKIPIVQEVRYFDRRILSVDPAPEQVVISSESFIAPELNEDGLEKERTASIPNVTGEPIILDTFARYKIVDPLQFMKTLRTVSGANARIENILKDATKAELGKTTLQELLSSARTSVMTAIQGHVNTSIKNDKLGIELVDVRIVRADLTADLRTSTVRRMISQLKERATKTRAEGEEQALEIRSTADKKRTVLLAEAQRDAQMLKGQGDKESIKIYAKAFNKNKEFYAFMRSMEAYKTTLANPETRLILSPNSDFFRYFKDVAGASR